MIPSGSRDAWMEGGIIMFGGVGGLMRVAASGGDPTPITRARVGQPHHFPVPLPGGRHVLFFVSPCVSEQSGIYVASIETGESTLLMASDSGPAYSSATRHVLFVRQGVLLAQRLDEHTLAVDGEPVRVAEGVNYGCATGSPVSTSRNGVLA
jgi:hypothetical protein